MEDSTNKYLNLIRGAFILIGVLGYVNSLLLNINFLIGLAFGKLIETLIALLLPLPYLIFGFFIKVKKKFIWILAIILSASLLIKGVPPIGFPPFIKPIIAVLLLIYLLKPQVRKYYF